MHRAQNDRQNRGLSLQPLLRLGVFVAAVVLTSHMAAKAAGAHASADRERIEDIGASAFPFEGEPDGVVIPESEGTRFFARDPDGRAFHMAPRGGKLFEETYQDRRSLLVVPKGFRPDVPAALVLFLHGNLATLDRDVARRQRVPAQVAESRANVLLVAPQMATNALDSSAGNFWTPGFLDRYLDAAGRALADMPASRLGAEQIAGLPVIVVAYSGGYLPAAFSLMYSREAGRRPIAGVILLDALFGEEAKFADWIEATRGRSFFVSLHSKSSAGLNAKLERDIGDVPFLRTLPSRIGPGDVAFQLEPTAVHNDFVTQAGIADPLAAVLARIDLARLAGDARDTAPR